LALLGTTATSGLTVPTPSDYDNGEVGGMIIWQGKINYSEKTCPSAALSTTNPTCSARKRTPAAAVGSQGLTS
jgi:hypothetical protein